MLHHIHTVSGLLAAALLLSAPVQAALPAYSAVKDEAKTVNKYMIVVWAGTDWSPKSREITRAVEHLAKNSPEPVLWCIQDEREEMTEEEQKLPKPPGEIWNIPAIQVVSPTGNMVFLSEGVSRETLPAVMKQAMEAVKQQNKANALWEKAAASSGTAAALLYGEGLQQLPPYAASARKDILEKIKKADPEDIKGVHFKYTFRHLPYIEKVQRMVNDSAKDGGPKDYKTAHAYVNKQLKTPGLTPLQKQQVMAARFWLYRNEGKKDQALKTLTDIARISPKTLMGIGAQNYYRYLTEPVTLKSPHFTGYDLRPELTPARQKWPANLFCVRITGIWSNSLADEAVIFPMPMQLRRLACCAALCGAILIRPMPRKPYWAHSPFMSRPALRSLSAWRGHRAVWGRLMHGMKLWLKLQQSLKPLNAKNAIPRLTGSTVPIAIFNSSRLLCR